MNKSESIAKLAEALAKAQSKMRHAEMSGVNPHFQSRYATLADVIDAIRGPLTENGLSFVQLPDDQEGGICVHTVLMHESGEWIASLTAIPVTQRNAHGVGSALTYGRRYGLQSICGIAAEEDDDANIAATGERDPRAKLQETMDLLRDAMEREDDGGWWEVWSELTPQQIDFLHSQGTRYLSHKMKTYAKAVEFKMRPPKAE